MTNPDNGQQSEVDKYLERHVAVNLAALSDDGEKATWLGHELNKWDRIEDRLLAWAKKDDGSPCPFSPPISAFQITSIKLRLNAELYGVLERVKARIAALDGAAN